ncbi:MAG: peptidylprolyl isomerase [Gammaproteobacteria bacterium]
MQVEVNKVVSIIYRIHGEDGILLEQVDLPVTYVHGGEGRLFEKIESALEGHVVGDIIEVPFAPEEGFGRHNPALTFTDDIENVPPQYRHVGAEVEMKNDQGEARTFTVTRMENGQLTVDCNHPLAGKMVTFTVQVMDIRDATPEEIENGSPAAPSLH